MGAGKAGPLCVYCGSQRSYTQTHADVDAAGGWDVVAREHEVGCRWIATKGYPGEPVPADIRAAVLAGLDREITDHSTPRLRLAHSKLLDALLLLREEYERHQPLLSMRTCVACRRHWPCPSIAAAAQLYAPDALRERVRRE